VCNPRTEPAATHPLISWLHAPHRYAHEGILRCAKAVRDHLDYLGLLDHLLLGPAAASDGTAAAAAVRGKGANDYGSSQQGGSLETAAAAAGGGSSSSGGSSSGGGVVEWLRPGVEGRDCRGWRLVVTGHSLGELGEASALHGGLHCVRT